MVYMRNYKIKNLYFARVANICFQQFKRGFCIFSLHFNLLFINNNIPFTLSVPQ